jgi:hypothetical protein
MKEVNKWFSRNNFVSIKIFLKILDFRESFFRGLCQFIYKQIKSIGGNEVMRLSE